MADEKLVYKKPKNKIHVFDVINYIVFILIGLLVLVPLWILLFLAIIWIITFMQDSERKSFFQKSQG